jgi:hypothetical protein
VWKSASSAHLDEISGALQSLRSEAACSRRLNLDPTADKQEIRRYLLGALDADRKTLLEERILSVPEAYEEVSMVEDELVQDYVAGGLSELERQQFETSFLTTAERQKNLRFAQLLTRYVNAQSVPVAQKNNAAAAAAIPHAAEKSAPAKKSFMFSLLPANGRPALLFCIAGVALLGITLLSWFVFRRPPLLPVQQRAEHVVVVTLAPGSITTGNTTAQRVNVPPKGYNLKLELELANASFRNYKSELFRENKRLQTHGELRIEPKGEQYVVPLTITGEILSPGEYEVKLSGVSESGADAFIEKYSFRVIE